MENIIKIRANDEPAGEEIFIGIEDAEYDGEIGYRVCASNGDDIGYYKPKSREDCIRDIYAMYRTWDYEEIED